MYTFYTVSHGIASAPELPALLGGPVKKLRDFQRDGSVMVGWGQKENTLKAKSFAQKQQLPYWQLEDGFISYLGHPAQGDRRFSLITDKTGIYYDATQPSDIENLLNKSDWQTPELLARADKLLGSICQHRISKYNHEPVVIDGSAFFSDSSSEGFCSGRSFERVLVVDQTFGDSSVAFGMADMGSFQAMLHCALQENPNAEVWVKVHPDVVLGTKRGYFELEPCGTRIKGFNNDRIRVLAAKVNAQSLFSWFSKVYVVTSQLGFEALWHKKSVVCFGVPFYSGWGLTDDREPCPRRTGRHSVESLFAAACLLYTRYIHPETHEQCELEDVLALIVLQQEHNQPKIETLYALGFSLWKRAFVSRFAHGLARRIVYLSNDKALRKQLTERDGVLLWGMQPWQQRPEYPVPLWRMEDGFIRSVGLGAELRRPCSLVLDSRGIYYNAMQPSDLEQALNTQVLSYEDRQRGQNLIHQLLAQRISKYNLKGNQRDPFHGARPDQRKVLVTGQVDSDASLKYGSPAVCSNRDLLQRVREHLADRNTFIVYKPHPDVVQAGRAGHLPEAQALQWADRVVADVDIFDCIQRCDELHVMSSQAGFEALLQNKTVHCWGMPFYAGWGLTVDHMSCPRRVVRRSIDELVYITLCLYPRYVHWRTGRFTTPERLIRQLVKERKSGQASSSGLLAWLGRKQRKLLFLLEALRAS
ncbi:capsular polysaccharide biosynthesis protein [Endozoicomonas sp. GU-1]|uniref:capsular polysaccharide biosynthesis protein n=1 Tax=Endozoicomonas sp. GU-1 TaxID=3009078 RepID=UPI0022B30069|nr:capsular polysaccharide biosynthesis protein [Endozoicomonas sp. GU-1]WBA82910.1 capsular polysaccharide biosynthesis protein [Endozoicomonas sp. GU-1]WBA85837.1 capsular polysaccharide biosynthesis protein [Endozoicomonas sp. GU-1]